MATVPQPDTGPGESLPQPTAPPTEIPPMPDDYDSPAPVDAPTPEGPAEQATG